MEQSVDNAKKIMGTDQGKEYEQQIQNMLGDNGGEFKPTGDPQTQDPTTHPPGGSTDRFGIAGQPGQYGEEGQYGAVRGKGFGGGFKPDQKPGPGNEQQGAAGQQDSPGKPGPQGQAGRGRPSAYEGMDADDSTATGGYGRNAKGSSFSRQNQMAAESGLDPATGGYADDDEPQALGYLTGTSTPGYRQEGDVDAEAVENRMRNQNMNVYGQQADDSGAKGNDYNEAI